MRPKGSFTLAAHTSRWVTHYIRTVGSDWSGTAQQSRSIASRYVPERHNDHRAEAVRIRLFLIALGVAVPLLTVMPSVEEADHR